MPYETVSFKLTSPTKINFFLTKNLSLPLCEVSRLIDKGRVSINKQVLEQKSAISMGDLDVIIYKPNPRGLSPIFSTADFAVFNKPSNMLVHQNGFNQEQTLMDDVRNLFGYKANLVHRIDRETSGLVMVSRHKKAESALKTMLSDRLITKHYLAFVQGRVEKEQLLDIPILSKNLQKTNKMPRVVGVVSKNGLKSRTMIYPLHYFEDLDISLIKARLITGRTHQIRIHLAHINHKILGDPFYGSNAQIANDYLDKKLSVKNRLNLTGAKRIMLEAFSLSFLYKSQYHIETNSNFHTKNFLLSQINL